MDLPNSQRPEGRLDLMSALDLHSTFPTIQGEGPFSGAAAYFVRLAGCNLQCPLCDTEYTAGRKLVNVYALAEIVIAQPQRLVVITGGEPFRQRIATFVQRLVLGGKRVQIETNGKLPIDPIDLMALQECAQQGALHVVISPKTSRVAPAVHKLASAYKYVVCADDVDPEDLLPRTALGLAVPPGQRIARPPVGWAGPIYVHPADEQDPARNAANLRAAAAAVLHCPQEDRRLGLQVHKYAELE